MTDRLSLYQEYFETINLRRFLERYQYVGSYSYIRNIIGGNTRLTKKVEYSLQRAMLDFQDSQFDIINKVCKKDIIKN